VRQDSTTAMLVIVCDPTTKLGWATRAVDIVTVNLECMASALRGKNLDTRKTVKEEKTQYQLKHPSVGTNYSNINKQHNNSE